MKKCIVNDHVLIRGNNFTIFVRNSKTLFSIFCSFKIFFCCRNVFIIKRHWRSSALLNETFEFLLKISRNIICCNVLKQFGDINNKNLEIYLHNK